MSNLTINQEMQAITRAAAEPWVPGDSVKAAIGRAARTLGIGYRRARSFWYGDEVAVRAIEADRMRIAELHLLTQRQQRLRAELALIKARLDGSENDEGNVASTDMVRRTDGHGGGVGAQAGLKPREAQS